MRRTSLVCWIRWFLPESQLTIDIRASRQPAQPHFRWRTSLCWAWILRLNTPKWEQKPTEPPHPLIFCFSFHAFFSVLIIAREPCHTQVLNFHHALEDPERYPILSCYRRKSWIVALRTIVYFEWLKVFFGLFFLIKYLRKERRDFVKEMLADESCHSWHL